MPFTTDYLFFNSSSHLCTLRKHLKIKYKQHNKQRRLLSSLFPNINTNAQKPQDSQQILCIVQSVLHPSSFVPSSSVLWTPDFRTPRSFRSLPVPPDYPSRMSLIPLSILHRSHLIRILNITIGCMQDTCRFFQSIHGSTTIA